MPPARVRPALPFVLLGVACVVAGGLVSAATALSPSEHGAWAAAYLVLVGGVAQVGLALGQALLAPRPPSPAVVRAEFAAWNLGNVSVLVGTLARLPWLLYLGGVLLVVALGLVVLGVPGRRGAASAAPRWRLDWPLFAFRALVMLLLVSIPVGLVLAAVRHA